MKPDITGPDLPDELSKATHAWLGRRGGGL